MHWTMNGNQAWKLLLESSDALDAAMRGAIVHDPKDATRLVVRWLAHDLIDQSFERSDTALALTAAEYFGAMDIERSQVSPGAAALVLGLIAAAIGWAALVRSHSFPVGPERMT